MARKFLYFIAIAIILVLAGAFALSIWTTEITRLAMVPSADFEDQTPLASNAYQDSALWYSRPGIGFEDPSRWQPAYRDKRGTSRLLPKHADPVPDFAVFFVHPTSYYNRSAWNAPIGDEDAEKNARLFLRGLASAFNQANEVWAPKYRQATVGAFLTDAPEAQMAFDAAYSDVEQAYDYFLGSIDEETPIILAGHSQGAMHVVRLLADKVADQPIAERIAAAYVVGWPISITHDLPSLGLPACATSNQAGCIMSWSTFAEPADPRELMKAYSGSTGLDGELRSTSQILCTNPLSGTIGGDATAERNFGTLVPEGDLSSGELLAGYAPARCDERGLLLIGPAPEMGNAVLPGNNYHVYDIPLFWRNVQIDSVARAEAWHQSQQ
ncbi:DUF3089 domain-containing protein [Altererythrobacter sp. MF3-039]|uniref:DUF3089 domain-containing protein n=1 Tax=Altererythrobacter sp. MF3-039 TaxID=3252901 RepID=UPI00390C46FD